MPRFLYKHYLHISACALLALALAPAASAESWNNDMRGLSRALATLIPPLATIETFSAPASHDRILEAIRGLKNGAHRVSEQKAGPAIDPSLEFISRSFESDVAEAESLFQAGKLPEARDRLKHVTRSCVSCHTQKESQWAPQLEIPMSAIAGLSELEQAEYFAAFRQFDKAIIHFEYGLTDPVWAQEHPREWATAFEKLLAVVIRVKNHPGLSLEMVSRFLDSRSYPKSLAPVARIWRKQIKDWRMEKATGNLLEQSRKLAARAAALDESGPARSSLVLYVLTSARLHRYFGATAPEARSTEALYLAGVAAEHLADINFWNLPEQYFGECAKAASAAPQDAWAIKCRERLAVGTKPLRTSR
jgi:hypothetical protein